MKRVTITTEDEYQHPPSENPLCYSFNAYDPEGKTGISIKMERSSKRD